MGDVDNESTTPEMTKSPEELLTMRFGGATVADNLKRAIEAGKIIEHEDGTLEFRPAQSQLYNWIPAVAGPPYECQFLRRFLFQNAYARSAVPYGCRECYKVKVVPRTLRQLVAAWHSAKRIDCPSKWGVDLNNRCSQDVYAGYFYVTGLEAARVLYKVAREAFDADPKLGPDVSMRIKRGCSEYEAAVGPSDRYEFSPEMAELETYLKTRFQKQRTENDVYYALGHWIDVAFCIGDNTYLDFTGGKPLRPKSVSYDP